MGIFGLALLAAVAIANGETATRIAERAIASLLVATDKLSARGHLPDGELQSKFNLIAARHFDRNAMARAALGTQLPAEARANWSGYRRAYDAFLAKSFVRGVRDAGAAVSAVKGARIGPSASPVVAPIVLAGRHRRSAVAAGLIRHWTGSALVRIRDDPGDDRPANMTGQVTARFWNRLFRVAKRFARASFTAERPPPAGRFHYQGEREMLDI
ncbi:MAG TPA: hypothetical protein VIN77_09610, partial [Aurantimonas sp.]